MRAPLAAAAALLVLPLLMGYAGTPDPAMTPRVPGLSGSGDRLSFRSDLAFAGDFVRALVHQGVKVEALNHSVYNGFFEDTKEAAHLTTPQGVIEVVVFPYDVSSKVHVTRQYDAEGGVFLYAVQRHPGPDGTTTIDSPCPLAVQMAGHYFILTDSERLAKLVQHTFHPTLPTEIPAI